MSRQLTCNCGNCGTCKRREIRKRYRSSGSMKKYHTVFDTAENPDLSKIEDDVKELEETFPWLKFDFKKARCASCFARSLDTRGK